MLPSKSVVTTGKVISCHLRRGNRQKSSCLCSNYRL